MHHHHQIAVRGANNTFLRLNSPARFELSVIPESRILVIVHVRFLQCFRQFGGKDAGPRPLLRPRGFLISLEDQQCQRLQRMLHILKIVHRWCAHTPQMMVQTAVTKVAALNHRLEGSAQRHLAS